MKKPSLSTLAFLAAALLIIWLPVPVYAEPAARSIRIAAEDFAFQPAVVRVNHGDTVTMELSARDVAHGLAIDGYPVDVQAEPGQPARITFVAGRAGSYTMRCSLACGNLHPFMTGKFVVGPNLLLYRAAALGLLAFIYGARKASK